MGRQTTSIIAMVDPNSFFINPETYEDNQFMNKLGRSGLEPSIHDVALEQAHLVQQELERNGVTVFYFNGAPNAPDGVFPNNWFVTDETGRFILCPMKAQSRRKERRVFPAMRKKFHEEGYRIREIVDLSYPEKNGEFCEGTGSLVLDRRAGIAYANISERTTESLVRTFAELLGYRPLSFRAFDPEGKPIYHTNVIMSIGTEYAVACLECIEPDSRQQVADWLTDPLFSGRTLIEISWDQVTAFAGNILEVTNQDNEKLIVISRSALTSYRADQLNSLLAGGARLIQVDIPLIQELGGGGVRCMLAEIFLPRERNQTSAVTVKQLLQQK